MQCQEKNKLEFSINAILKKDSNFFIGKINNFNPEKILDKEIINSLNFFNNAGLITGVFFCLFI